MPNNKPLDNLIPISPDLQRSTTPHEWCEVLTFRSDSGYDLDTIYRRCLGILERAFRKGPRVNPDLGFVLDQLPHFHPANRLRLTIELLPPEKAPDSPQGAPRAPGS